MIKPFFLIGCIAVTIHPLFADTLANSLNGMLNHKEPSGMVNLSGIHVGAKKRVKPENTNRVVRKTRPSNTVIGHYDNGNPVFKKEANDYLKKVTKGKIKDLDLLPRKQRLIVLKDLQKIYAMKHFKSRSSKAVIATVNGMEIHKKQADAYLKSVTHGKVKDFDRLPEKQRLLVIQDLAKPILVKEEIRKSITLEEKEEIFKQMWIEKKRSTLNVSNEEMTALYEKKKALMLAENPNADVPSYMSIASRLKSEIFEEKIIGDLMNDAKIIVNYDNKKTITTHELNRSLVKFDKITNRKEQ